MKVLAFLFLLHSPALAKEAWQKCFDSTDFNFSVDTFVDSKRISRAGCIMKFVEVSGKGQRWELDICDSKIKIKEYASLQTTLPSISFAGSAACPAPLFGADNSLEASQKGGEAFLQAKERIKLFFKRVKEVMAPNINFADLDKYLKSQNTMAEAKLACAEYFLQEYLDQCVAFEAPPAPVKEAPPVNIPGVHPETIEKK